MSLPTASDLPAEPPSAEPIEALAVVEPAAEPVAADTIETPAAEEPEAVPTLLQRAQALVKSKPALQAEASDLKKQLAQALDDNALLTARVSELEEEAVNLNTELTSVEAVVSTLEAERKTAFQEATEMVAATGVPAADLPEQEAEPDETLATLEASLSAATDPREKGKIAAKIRTMR